MKTTERQAGDITIVDVQGRIMFGDGEEAFRDVAFSRKGLSCVCVSSFGHATRLRPGMRQRRRSRPAWRG